MVIPIVSPGTVLLVIDSTCFIFGNLKVPEAGDNYGVSPSEIVGRGFETLVSGYDEGFDGVVNSNGTVVQQPRKPGIYIHTTDMGNSGRGYFVWSQQAKLIARDARAGDKVR